jgi:hypothetical protein
MLKTISPKSISAIFFILFTFLNSRPSFGQCYLPRANMKAFAAQQLNPCQGEAVEMEAAYRPAGVQYQWYKDGSPIAGAIGPVYQATENGNYHFVYRQGDTCQSTFYDLIPLTYRPFPKPAAPTLNLQNLPDSQNCFQSFTISIANVSQFNPTDTLFWLNDGVPVPGANQTTFSGSTLGIYRLLVKSAGGCFALSGNAVTAQLNGSYAKFQPRIKVASVVRSGITQRCQVSWALNSPQSDTLRRIRILRERLNAPGVFEAVDTLPISGTTYTPIDESSSPWERPYYYRIQGMIKCGADSFYTAPSRWHKCVHLNLTRSGNIVNLLWTPYEGFPIASFRILCLNDNGQLLDSITGIPPEVSSYSYLLTNNEISRFQVEAVSSQTEADYMPWGRISANLPLKTKSNTRPTILSIPGGDSTSIFNKEVVVTSVKNRNPALSFQIYPSPSRDGSCILSMANPPDAVDLYDATGRKQAASLQMLPGGVRLQASAEFRNGLYFVKVRSGGRFAVQRWILQR